MQRYAICKKTGIAFPILLILKPSAELYYLLGASMHDPYDTHLGLNLDILDRHGHIITFKRPSAFRVTLMEDQQYLDPSFSMEKWREACKRIKDKPTDCGLPCDFYRLVGDHTMNEVFTVDMEPQNNIEGLRRTEI